MIHTNPIEERIIRTELEMLAFAFDRLNDLTVTETDSLGVPGTSRSQHQDCEIFSRVQVATRDSSGMAIVASIGCPAHTPVDLLLGLYD